MIQMKNVMAIARAERLITRRLARYWIFLGLAYFIGIIYYTQLAVIHGLFSSYSATVAVVTPRFLLSIMGMYYLAIFLVGTIFLAFDIRARDQRERMAEVLDSRPFSNLELIAGRYTGLFLSSWIPIVILAIIFEAAGLILKGVGVPVGEPLEVFSLFSFVFLMAIPALSFAVSLVFFVTLLVRNRLVASIILLLIVGVIYWAMVSLPSDIGGVFDIFGLGSSFFSSELAPSLATPTGWFQRVSVLLFAFSLLGFSAAVHPRLDEGSRPSIVLGSIIVLAVSVAFSAVVYLDSKGDISNREQWRTAHDAVSIKALPDMTKIEGTVDIHPGKDLFLDIDVTFKAPDDESIKKAFFTLNPGQKVEGVTASSGTPLQFVNENGLLEIELLEVIAPGHETTVHIIAKGLPDDSFAYLYSAFDLTNSTGIKSGDIPLLGMFPGVFDNSYVALMPGLRWLPMSGPDKNRDDPRLRPVDFYNVDLRVILPEGWLAAGPGRRQETDEKSERSTFRFASTAPVPEVALLASRFESRAMKVEGVEFEILISKKHMKNLEVLSGIDEKMREWLEIRLQEAKEFGLEYPYDALTLVEAPNFLRSYGGGWRMDTTLAPPGMLIMREMGFPTARFDAAFRNPDKFKDYEGGIEQAKWERLLTFFMNDFAGGNVLSGGARNFFMYQTCAEGPEALALNYVMETLTNLLVTEKKSYFSAHIFLEGQGIDSMLTTLLSSSSGSSIGANFVDRVIDSSSSRPEVWDSALGVSLAEMDPWKEPGRTVDVLNLKANAFAQAILDTLGRENTGRLLASIRKEHRGGSFTLNDLQSKALETGYDLAGFLGDWLKSSDLPGFVCENARAYRIPDSEDGTPRYQLLFTIRNDEPVPGSFRIVHVYNLENNSQLSAKSDPIQMKGKGLIQYGIIVNRPPAYAMLHPYLSLNRVPVFLPLNSIEEGKIEKAEPVTGLKELPYTVPQQDFIEVDDLDSGFAVADKEEAKGLRIAARKNSKFSGDNGLPITSVYRVPGTWSRAVYTGNFGKYRHTMAVTGAGKGEKSAMFTAGIPHSGKWILKIFIPWKENIFPERKWGTYHLSVTDSNGDEREITFDSNAASPGWNLVGSLDLSEGETIVSLTNKTDGHLVIADAIRWEPSANQ